MGQSAREVDMLFMEAIAVDDWKEADRALAEGADIECPFSPEGSPLHTASVFGDARAVVFLMDRGATGEAGTAVHPNRSTPLHLAAGCSPLTVAAILARSPHMARAADAEGSTPLMVAASIAPECMSWALLAASDVDAVGPGGRTALDLAAVAKNSAAELIRAWILSRDERAELGLCAEANPPRPAPRI